MQMSVVSKSACMHVPCSKARSPARSPAPSRHSYHQQQRALQLTACNGLAPAHSCTWGHSKLLQRRGVLCHASSSGEKVIKQIPIFPLSVVALPNVVVPLHIFEPRYRVLFNTILSGDEGVEEALVVKDSEFVGCRKFGMCLVDSKGRLAGIGTTLEVQQFLPLDDGRLYITSKGVERFTITKVRGAALLPLLSFAYVYRVLCNDGHRILFNAGCYN